MTTRGRKPRPGHITFVGSGPGDPGLLTTRAATVLTNAALVFTDPDVADVRGDVDWDALAAAPGPLILQATPSHLADAARTLIEHELAETTPCVVTAQGTTCQQRSVETTLHGLTDSAMLGATDPAGPM